MFIPCFYFSPKVIGVLSRVYMAHGPSARTVRRRVAAATQRSIAAMQNTTCDASSSAINLQSEAGSVADISDDLSDDLSDNAVHASASPASHPCTVPAAANTYDTDSDGPLDTSDDDDDDDPVTEEGRVIAMMRRLGQWKLQHNITNSAFNDLLKIVRHEHPSLPKDSRTLVAPPKDLQYTVLDDGTYHHFGLVSGVTTALQHEKDFVSDGFCLELQLGIDGLPVHKSTRWQLWPILGKVQNVPSSHVFIIGVFFGETKPSSCPRYLAELMNEYTAVRNTGFELLGYNVKLQITTVICDAQARAFVKCVKQYNHTHGCDKCCEEGEFDGRTMFLGQNAARRTDESFREKKDKDHHQADKANNFIISPFETAGLGVLHRVYVYAGK